MRNKIISIMAVAIIALTFMTSEADALPKVKVKKFNECVTVNPVSLMWGILNVTYEKTLSPKNSFTAGISYKERNGFDALGLSASYRWYYPIDRRRMIEGLSFGPFGELMYWTYNGIASDVYDGGASMNFGGEVAYKLIIEKWMTIEPIVKIYVPLFTTDGINMQYWSIGVNLGYAW